MITALDVLMSLTYYRCMGIGIIIIWSQRPINFAGSLLSDLSVTYKIHIRQRRVMQPWWFLHRLKAWVYHAIMSLSNRVIMLFGKLTVSIVLCILPWIRVMKPKGHCGYRSQQEDDFIVKSWRDFQSLFAFEVVVYSRLVCKFIFSLLQIRNQIFTL